MSGNDAISPSIKDRGSDSATLPAKRTHSGQRAIKAPRSQPASAPSTPDVITTGAFYTRATLRQLGVAESLVDPETETGVCVGDHVKVLSLDKAWYTAVVLSVAGGKALVHYPGWEHRFNEWIGLGSRRLVAGQGGGSGPEDFDLDTAIQEALGTDKKVPAEEDNDDADDEDADEAVDLPRPRGRPTGSRNRRRVGHIKKRIRKAPPPKEPPTPSPPSPEAAPVEAPLVAPEYRIAKARTLSSQSSNPYAKQVLATQSFASDSDNDASTPGNDVWQLVRGPYVTTGAFLTRRTIKCLAHNDATGGIIQDHHGVYPGQMVEVMNANRTWYRARVISYADKKFLVHFVNWDHSHDEWVAAGSKRLRKAPMDESEEEARRICAVLVNEYNDYVESIEKAREEEEAKKLVKRRIPPTKPTVVPVSAQQASLAGKAIAQVVEEEEEEEIDEDVDPISVDSGFTPVPQLLRVKDYVQIYRRGMVVAARDRNKVWWKAEIVDIRTFRFRIHYIGFPKVWDEWMEMNTQRVMLADKQPTPPPALAEAVPGSDDDDDDTESSSSRSSGSSSSSDAGDENMQPVAAAAVVAGNSAEKPPGKRPVGRPPGAEPKPAPLSLRLALKALESEEGAAAAADDDDVFPLPKEHMSTKDYGMFLRVGDVVSIRDRDKQWYACTIIDVKHGRIRICFNGHPEEYNQWVAVNSDRIHVLRSTVSSDGRLAQLAHDAQMAQRRKREKVRAQRRARHGGPSVASLVRVAESLEHISEACADDQPLMYRLAAESDGLPLVTRLLAEGAQDSATWFVYCNQCRVVIRTFRYYCVSCERPSAGFDYESFDLCLACFARRFPRDHPHPPACFARAAVGDAESIVAFTAGALAACRAQMGSDALAGLAAAYERDSFDAEYQPPLGPEPGAGGSSGWGRLAAGLHGTATATDANDRGAVIGQADGASQQQPRCAFCAAGEDGNAFAGGGGRPFVSHEGRRFWAHDACARYAPEVLVTDAGVWYNVEAAVRRARTIKCAGCRKRGAAIGCFHERCQRSYHVACTGMTAAELARGMIFWCPKHSRTTAEDEEEAVVGDSLCACCGRRLGQELMWMVCAECPLKDRQGFCVCLTCYEAPAALANHPHKKRCFRERLTSAPATARPGRYAAAVAAAAPCCHYCRRRNARRWRRGYGGVVMCDACFGAAHSLHDRELFAEGEEGEGEDAVEVVALNPFGDAAAGALVEDYAHSAYFTRDACTTSSLAPLGRLASYAPTDSMLFTLIVDSTYFDIPGRAPRWASHSGSDYHGTWLPQTVRRALLRYTRRGERVLSNFLGRGTDAIECFLLSRKCVGVDINPSAVALAQRNCSFPTDTSMAVEFRPAIMHGDARALCEKGWPGAGYFAEEGSFDHVLSHPPYKDCVLYSTNIDGDLSRFPGPEEFRREMEKVIATSWRLLRMGRYLTLGIGDNRAECFYIPVSFQLIRSYISYGFVLDELIVKRQRYCQAFGLGTYLCVQFDFLMFTHEFIATLRKIPRADVDSMVLPDECYAEHAETDAAVVYERVLREVPPSPIERKSVVMGSVWTFDRHHRYSFPQLCMSRMVERFGRDAANWEHVDLALASNNAPTTAAMSSDDSDSDDESSGSSVEFQDNGTRAGDYERQRQRQIQQNRAQLLHLGLVSELGEDSSDTAHYLKLLAMAPRPHAPLALIVVPHIPNAQLLLPGHLAAYRRALVQLTHDASRRLCPAGLLVLGTQDVRDATGKLWPLGMLILEDVQRAVGAIRLRLKEFIVVVEHGHARKRDDVESRDKYVEEPCILDGDNPRHLPIVHAYYLVFMKLR